MSILSHPAPARLLPAARPSPDGPPSAEPVRLRLRPAGEHQQALVDGAWWPRTDDLVTELAPLLAEMAEHGHVVHRISFSLQGWHGVPRKLRIAGVLVRLGGYRTQSPAVIHLVDSSGRAPTVLVVVPPATAADVAQRVLQLAVTSPNLDARALLDAAR